MERPSTVMSSTLLTLLLSSSIYAGGLTDSMHPDPDIKFSVFGAIGSGMSMTGQGEARLQSRTPLYLNLGATADLSQLHWLRFDASILFEFERRVGLGLQPRLRAKVISRPRFQLSAGVAMPVFVSPYTLLGIGGFARAQLKVLPHMHLFAEPTVTAFIAGTDLVKGQGLLKMDMLLGLNFPL